MPEGSIMSTATQSPGLVQATLERLAQASGSQLAKWARNDTVRRLVMRQAEKMMLDSLEKSRPDPRILPGIQDDRTAMGLAIMGSIDRALAEGRLSDASLEAVVRILVKSLFYERGDQSAANKFEAEHGWRPPTFLLISPTKACNLRCTGCYADADGQQQILAWSTVDRMIDEAKALWGARFMVISGGEPFAYHSEGKGIVDLIEKHSDCLFMVYTNSTLITKEVSQRLSQAGNVLLAISVEGWRERTDQRRGAGVFDRVLESMAMLRQDGVAFGFSLTGTRDNAEEILSDEFLDFFIEQGVLFGWLFQYMPIGRAFTLDLMVTPEQRLWMWRRSWEIVRERRFFLADFWNHGTACGGCLSAGGHGSGGYFYIDWNGAVSPCVFMPYSPVNIKDVYTRGGDLNQVWEEPFFRALRGWQQDYQAQKRNGLAPCPNRDHHEELEQLLWKYEPEPIDANARETIVDPNYTRGLVAYSRELERLTSPVWENHYVFRERSPQRGLAPLPEVPPPDEVSASVAAKAEE